MGPKSRCPSKFSSCKSVSLQGFNVFPAFVDCHTHLLFAGDRKDEFELRNQGISYQEVARRGGGILSTMKATRKALPGRAYSPRAKSSQSLPCSGSWNYRSQEWVWFESKG